MKYRPFSALQTPFYYIIQFVRKILLYIKEEGPISGTLNYLNVPWYYSPYFLITSAMASRSTSLRLCL